MKQYFEVYPYSESRKEYKEKYGITGCEAIVEKGVGLPKNYNVELYKIDNEKIGEKVFEINIKSSSPRFASTKAFDVYVKIIMKHSEEK